MFDVNRRKTLRVNYPCQLTVWLANEPDQTILANAANIGLGGLCVNLEQDIEVGTKMDIQLNFTDTTTPFRCRGAVVRSRKESEKFYNIGIQFEPLNELKYSFLKGKILEIIAFEQKGKS